MRLIVNIIRTIISIYLCAVILVWSLFFTSKKSNGPYPSIAGYTYYVVDDYRSEPELPKGTVMVLKKDEDTYTAKEGDYVLFKNGDLYELKKVMSLDASEDALDEYLVGYVTENEADYTTVKKMNVIANSYYHNSVLTIAYHILTNWFVILLLLIFLVLSPNLTYKRFELD